MLGNTLRTPRRRAGCSHRRGATLVALVLLHAGSATQAGWREDIGLTALQARLGASMPRGETISVAQIEMATGSSGDYLPDRLDPQFGGKTLQVMSGQTGATSHATTVGGYLYGLVNSPAPAIATIDAYEMYDWATLRLLRTLTGDPPAIESRRIQNHSWTGSLGLDSVDADALRRVDLIAERDGVLVVAAVRNGSVSPMPRLLASTYNGLTVGLSNGASSYGPTRLDAPGRVKPDLVAPMTATSWAAPVVGACGAILLEAMQTAGTFNHLPPEKRNTAQVLTAKALLMGGASKAALPDWRRGLETPVTDGTVPLDYRYGAGQLDIDTSYRLFENGRHGPGTGDVPLAAWNHTSITAGEIHRYYFTVPACNTASATALLTWNRKIVTGTGNPLPLTPILADMDLALFKVSGGAPEELVDLSISSVDNVEHIHVTNLSPGRYVLEVMSDSTWEYALTWDVRLEPIECSPDRTIMAWRSVRTHGDTPLAITLNPTGTGNGPNTPTTETRAGGVLRIEVDFSGPMTLVDPSRIYIVGRRTIDGVMRSAKYYSHAGVTMLDEDTAVIQFAPGTLYDEACYTITITPGAFAETIVGDADVKVRMLAGDTNGNGVINLGDMLLVRTAVQAGTPAAAAPHLDVNGDNAITLDDAQWIQSTRISSPPRKAFCP